MQEITLSNPTSRCFRSFLNNKQLHTPALTRIHMEHQAQTRELVYQYNHQRSTCISTAMCQRICKSIDYILDHALAQKSNPLESLQTESIASLYVQGCAAIERSIQRIHEVQANLLQHPLPFLNERYLSILQEQLPRFLNVYETRDKHFRAYACREDFDYPLLDGLPLYHRNYGLKGVDFVYEYLSRMQLEQHFLAAFPKAGIEEFIFCYEQQHDVSVELLGCNLCEMILTQLLLLLLLPTHDTLVATKAQAVAIEQVLQQTSLDDTFLDTWFQKLQSLFPHELSTYIAKGKDSLSTVMRLAKDNVTAILITFHEDSSTYLDVTPACDPEIFQTMMEKLSYCETFQAKQALLAQTPLGFHDYLDLFHDYPFSEEEYQALFDSFDVLQLAMLLYTTQGEYFHFHIQITLDESFLQSLEFHDDWEISFINYLTSMESEKKTELEKTLLTLRVK